MALNIILVLHKYLLFCFHFISFAYTSLIVSMDWQYSLSCKNYILKKTFIIIREDPKIEEQIAVRFSDTIIWP